MNGDFLAPFTKVSPLNTGIGFVGGFLWWLGRSFIWAILALLVVLFLPRNAERAADAAVAKPVVAGGLGCLTLLIAPAILFLLIMTICGIPIGVSGPVRAGGWPGLLASSPWAWKPVSGWQP